MLKFKRIKLTPQRHSKVQIILIKNEKLIAFLVISYFSIMFLGHLFMDIFQILRFPWKHVDNILANMMLIFEKTFNPSGHCGKQYGASTVIAVMKK